MQFLVVLLCHFDNDAMEARWNGSPFAKNRAYKRELDNIQHLLFLFYSYSIRFAAEKGLDLRTL